MRETLVLLHGFGGTRHTWDRAVAQLRPESYRPLALDLPGHGDADTTETPITFDSCVESVLGRSPKRFALGGYSLGGRVALHVALTAPERIIRLVLVSTSAGIEDPTERSARRVADRRLAEQLERIPFGQFVAGWQRQPLFAADPPEVGELAREDQHRNRPSALAAVLRGIGAGEMTPLWGRLPELQMPVIVVAGERDVKFRALAERMAALAPQAQLIVLPGGHRLPLESPRLIARVFG